MFRPILTFARSLVGRTGVNEMSGGWTGGEWDLANGANLALKRAGYYP